MVRVKILRNTFVDGKAVHAGSVHDLSDEDAATLIRFKKAKRVEASPRPGVPGTQVTTGDPRVDRTRGS